MNKLFFPLLSLIAALGLYFMYISPTYEGIQLLEAKEEEFNNAFNEVREVRNILQELESTYSGISRSDLRRLEIFLPKKIDMARVVQNVGGIVSKYGAPMERIKVSSEEKLSGAPIDIRKHEMSFTLDADYSDFLKIISDIEKNIQLASVSEINLEKVDTGETGIEIASTIYNISLTLYSYE